MGDVQVESKADFDLRRYEVWRAKRQEKLDELSHLVAKLCNDLGSKGLEDVVLRRTDRGLLRVTRCVPAYAYPLGLSDKFDLPSDLSYYLMVDGALAYGAAPNGFWSSDCRYKCHCGSELPHVRVKTFSEFVQMNNISSMVTRLMTRSFAVADGWDNLTLEIKQVYREIRGLSDWRQ